MKCNTLCAFSFVDDVTFAHNWAMRHVAKWVQSKWLTRGQKGFDAAANRPRAYAQSDSPGDRKDSTLLPTGLGRMLKVTHQGAELGVYDCLVSN